MIYVIILNNSSNLELVHQYQPDFQYLWLDNNSFISILQRRYCSHFSQDLYISIFHSHFHFQCIYPSYSSTKVLFSFSIFETHFFTFVHTFQHFIYFHLVWNISSNRAFLSSQFIFMHISASFLHFQFILQGTCFEPFSSYFHHQHNSMSFLHFTNISEKTWMVPFG